MGSSPFGFKNKDNYTRFLGLVSHEFFHTWNVKQLRPKGLYPYDYTKENYTRELWIAEGTTSYYGDLLLVRAGFRPAEKYLESLAGEIQGDRLRPGNRVQPVSESSYDAWVKFWKGTEQSYNAESDYYGKGDDVSLLLDLEIRKQTMNLRSLDDVMKTMFERFPLGGTGYTVEDFRKVAEEVAGTSLKKFFDSYVDGTEPLPWDTALGYAGLQIVPKDSIQKPWLGISTGDVGEKTRITRVTEGSPAYDAGLDIGDEILALDGTRVRAADLADRISNLKPRTTVTLTVFRSDRLREFTVRCDVPPVPTYKITRVAKPSDQQKAVYEGWLRSIW
jgi:predicted metalloprotease with PDZ domain